MELLYTKERTIGINDSCLLRMKEKIYIYIWSLFIFICFKKVKKNTNASY